MSGRSTHNVKKHIMQGVNRYFTTGVGLITSTGKHGSNVMAVEWTMQISYEPMLIAIFIHESSSTYENILKTKEFGVNMSSDEQDSLVNIAGGYSRKEIDKLNIGLFDIYSARYIKVPMLRGCIINAECLLLNHYKIGDHIAVIGEVVDAKFDTTRSPLVYHQGMYRKIGKKLSRNRNIVRLNKTLFEKLETMSKKAFTMRCVVAIVSNSRGEKLLIKYKDGRWKDQWTVPWFVVERKSDHVNAINECLYEIDLNTQAKTIAGIKRILFKHGTKQIRVNFVMYTCIANDISNHTNDIIDAKWYKKIPTNTMFKNLLFK